MLTLSFRSAAALTLLVTLAAASGCSTWTPGWETDIKRALPGDVSYVRPYIEAKEQTADTRGKLEEVIRLYGAMLRMYPQDFHALCKLGEYNCLMGFAYAKTKSQKKLYYEAAAQYCERAMYTDRAFKDLVDKGTSVGDACWVLSERDMDAMFFWVVTLSFYFEECEGGLGRMTHPKWTKQVKSVADQMMEVDPTWRDGAVYTLLGIYYANLKDRKGENMETSAEFFEKAIKAGPKSLLPRWARAKHYDLKLKDREAFKKDLDWVLAQNPKQSDDPGYAWNVCLQRNARALQEKADKLFGTKPEKASKTSQPEAPSKTVTPEKPARPEAPAKTQPPVAPAKPAGAGQAPPPPPARPTARPSAPGLTPAATPAPAPATPPAPAPVAPSVLAPPPPPSPAPVLNPPPAPTPANPATADDEDDEEDDDSEDDQ